MDRRGTSKSVSASALNSSDYWDLSAQPLNCLLFILPLIFLYEVGVVWAGPSAMRNGADVWLRNFLSQLGVGEYIFLPLATCGLLFGLHHISRRKWELRGDVLSGMICESFCFGVGILVVARVFWQVAHTTFSPTELNAFELEAAMTTSSDLAHVPRMLSYLGAGIYEELLFRFVLLSSSVWVLTKVGVDRFSSHAFAVLSTSLLFAAAHYQLFFAMGFEFTWYSFAFRICAGALFSLLYLRRGFGIVVGAHAVYDILVATIAA